MAQINHELFGPISYDMYWSGELTIKIFGREKTVIVSIDGSEEAEFQDAQKEAYSNLKNGMHQLMADAEQAIFDYYQDICEEYRAMVGEEAADEVAPIIGSKEALADLIDPTQVVIRRVRKNGIRRLGLLFECSWEIEHGLAVKFEDEQIAEVGFQDIVL